MEYIEDPRLGRPRRYYEIGKLVSMEEDALHEFKGHICLCDEEVSPRAQLEHSKAPVSK